MAARLPGRPTPRALTPAVSMVSSGQPWGLVATECTQAVVSGREGQESQGSTAGRRVQQQECGRSSQQAAASQSPQNQCPGSEEARRKCWVPSPHGLRISLGTCLHLHQILHELSAIFSMHSCAGNIQLEVLCINQSSPTTVCSVHRSTHMLYIMRTCSCPPLAAAWVPSRAPRA